MPCVIDPIPKGRLHGPMIYQERRYFHTLFFEDHSLLNFRAGTATACLGEAVIKTGPGPDVEVERFADVIHHVLGARRPPYPQWHLPSIEPTNKKQVGDGKYMIRGFAERLAEFGVSLGIIYKLFLTTPHS